MDLRALINSEMEILALAQGQNLKNRVGGRQILPITGQTQRTPRADWPLPCLGLPF